MPGVIMFRFLAQPQLRRLCIPLLLTELLWGVGTFFTLPATTVPAYLEALGASRVLIGLVAAAIGSLVVLPQIFGRSVVERFRHRKRGVILLHVGVLSVYLVIPLLDVLLRPAHPALLVWLIIGLLGLSQVVIGFVIPVWLDMMARIIPFEVRGTYFGVASGAFSLGGILGGVALTAMAHWLGANVFRGAFAASGVCFILSMTAFACAPVPESALDHPPEPSIASRLRKSLAACHPRTGLGRFLISFVLFSLALGVLSFVVVYAGAPDGLALPKTVFSALTLIEAIGGAIGAVILGVLVDRHGPRWPWVAMVLLLPAALLLLPFGHALPALAGVGLLLGTLYVIWVVSGPAMLELSPEGDKSGYIALINLATLPAAVIGPLLMGGIIKAFGFHPAFLLAIAISGLALIPALLIRSRAAAAPQRVASPES